jgi:hypothetical protein
MTTYHEIETALRELTRNDWERVSKSMVADVRRELADREPMPNAEEERYLWNCGYLD